MYRVVWADTRKCRLSVWGKISIVPRYMHGEEAKAKGHWVLERWTTPEVLIGMTREQYEGFLASMPGAPIEEYPVDGDYELAYVFENSVDEVVLHKMLERHEFRLRTRTKEDVMAELVEEEETKEKVSDEKFEEVYEEAREESLIHA